MSIISSIKSAGQKVATGVYNTVNKVGSSVGNAASNLSKQAAALTSSLSNAKIGPNSGLAAVASAFNPTPTPVATSASTKQPTSGSITSSPSAGAPRSIIGPSGPGAYVPSSSSGGSYTPYDGGAPANIPSSSIGNAYQALQRSSSASASPTISSRGSGGSLSDYLTGKSSNASSGFGTQTTTPSTTFSTYKGNTGTDSTTYYGGTPLSLEAQANNQGNNVDPNVAARRDSNRAVIANEEADAPRRKAEAEAAAAEAARIKAAADAAAQASMMTGADQQDPATQAEQAALDKEAKDLQKQYDALQRKVEELSRPSEEYLAALEEEKRLTEQENQVKTGLSSALNEVNNQPVAQGFLTGQGARLQNLANTDLDRIAGQKVTLQQRLATEAQRRAAAMDVAKIGLTRAGNRADTASSRAFEYGQTQTKRKQDKADKTYNLSAGERVVDSKGNVIASAPYKPETVPKNEQAKSDVNNAISQFRTIMQTKGWRGVSPDDYNTMAAHLQNTYGYEAVADLKAAMKANGMQVDDTNFDAGGGA